MRGKLVMYVAVCVLSAMKGTDAVTCFQCIHSTTSDAIPAILLSYFPKGLQRECKDPFTGSTGTIATCTGIKCIKARGEVNFNGVIFPGVIGRGCSDTCALPPLLDQLFKGNKECCDSDRCNTASSVNSMSVLVVLTFWFTFKLFAE